jgi:hypothetical protein
MRRTTAITAVLTGAAIVAAAAASALATTRPAGIPAEPTRASAAGVDTVLSTQLAQARAATAKYAFDLERAKADGYRIITRMIPFMGYHFLNPKVSGFDVRRPAILVYEHHGSAWQLGALEWVFPKLPAKPPLPGARYGAFGAACHYVDGTFVFARSQDECEAKSPETGAAFGFWHPPLVTLHLWLWYPNPEGLYTGTNPLVAPFNRG